MPTTDLPGGPGGNSTGAAGPSCPLPQQDTMYRQPQPDTDRHAGHNVTLAHLEQVIESLRVGEDISPGHTLHMGTWGYHTSCGTAACWYGSAYFLANGRLTSNGPPADWGVGPKTCLIVTLMLLPKLDPQKLVLLYDAIAEDGSRFDMPGVDLSHMDLMDATFQHSDLSGADLSGSTLSGSDFTGANLSGVFLAWATLRRSNLTGANLAGANLSGATLYGANLSDVDLTGANLRYADFNRARLTGSNLAGADLTGAILDSAELGGVDLSGAYWEFDGP